MTDTIEVDAGDPDLRAQPYVAYFFDPRSTEVSLVGGKAENLGRLTAAGFQVPPGFTITTEAYARFMTHESLGASVQALIDGLEAADAGALDERTEAVRDLILAAEIPREISAAVAEAYRSLSRERRGPPTPAHSDTVGEWVAVRSSGTAEDLPGASFAGLYDTYLDIRGEADVLHAVRSCWASMWTARATAYRARNGFDHFAARLAVVVQAMVEADAAGVMFTGNPVNARVDETLINANWGLGESVVAGIVTPDEYVIARNDLRTKRKSLGSKEVKIVRQPSGGISRRTTSIAERRCFVLTDEESVELGELGRNITAHYEGFPQDIEWAISDGQLYVLQSRPVTGVEFTWDEDIDAAIQQFPEDDEALWTQGWAHEYWTGAITPLFYSVRGEEIIDFRTRRTREWGFDPRLETMWRLRYRRATVYYNCELDAIHYQNALPKQLRSGYLANVPPDLREAVANSPFSALKLLRTYLRIWIASPDHSIHRWLPAMAARIEHQDNHGPTNAELRRMDDRTLKLTVADLMNTASVFMESQHDGFHLYAPMAMGLLTLMLQHWYPGYEANPSIIGDLLSGLPGTKTTAELRGLYSLAMRIRASETLRSIFDRYEGRAFFEALTHHDEGLAWLAEYDEVLLSEHGHRGQADRDIYFPRRSEDPSGDYWSLKPMLDVADEAFISPDDTEMKLKTRRQETTTLILDAMRSESLGLIKVQAFTLVLRYVQEFLVERDSERWWIDGLTMAKKRTLQEVGRRCVERGCLVDDEFYFLSLAELYEVLDRRVLSPLMRAKVDARRGVFFRFLERTELPPHYLKYGVPVVLDETRHSEGVLRGSGTSRGVATGTARVVKDLRQIGRINPGEILVCNATDPGWTPVFMVIKGLVLETGGVLAHGSLLSREYGLPAVVIPHAMQLIEDGATITINGETGEVRLDGSPDAAALA